MRIEAEEAERLEQERIAREKAAEKERLRIEAEETERIEEKRIAHEKAAEEARQREKKKQRRREEIARKRAEKKKKRKQQREQQNKKKEISDATPVKAAPLLAGALETPPASSSSLPDQSATPAEVRTAIDAIVERAKADQDEALSAVQESHRKELETQREEMETALLAARESHAAKVEALEEMLRSCEARLSDAQNKSFASEESLQEHAIENEARQAKLLETQDAHLKKIQWLEDELQSSKEGLELAHKDVVEMLRNEHESALASAKERSEQAAEELKSQFEARICAVNAENEKLVSRMKQMSTQGTEAALLREQLLDESEKNASRASSLESDLREAKGALVALDENLKRSRDEVVSLKASLSDAQDNLSECAHMESTLRERLEAAEIEADDANSECLRLEEDLNRARRDAEGIAAEKEELEMRCGALQDQDMKKSKQLREVQRTITGQLEEIDRLSKLVDAGREEGDAERRDWEDEKASLIEELESFAGVEQQGHKTEAKLKVALADLALSRNEADQVKRELSNLQDVLTKMTRRAAQSDEASTKRMRALVTKHEAAVQELSAQHAEELRISGERSASEMVARKQECEDAERVAQELRAKLAETQSLLDAERIKSRDDGSCESERDEHAVDARIVAGLVGTYVRVGIEKGPGAQREVLAIMANMLNFSGKERENVGLVEGQGILSRRDSASLGQVLNNVVFGPKDDSSSDVLPSDVEGKTFDELLIDFVDSGR